MWPVCLLKSEENWIYSVSSPVVSDSFPKALAYRPKGLWFCTLSFSLPLVFTQAAVRPRWICSRMLESLVRVLNSAKCGRSISPAVGACDQPFHHWSHVQDETCCSRGSETSVWQRPDQSNIHSHTCKFSVGKTRILLQNKSKNIRVEKFGVFFRFMSVSAFPPRFSHPLGGTVGSLLLWKKRLQLCIGRRDGAATEEPGSVGVWGKKMLRRIKRARIRMSTDANKEGGRGRGERCHIREAAHLPARSHGVSWLKCGAVMRTLTCVCEIPQTQNSLCHSFLSRLQAHGVKRDTRSGKATGSRLFRVWCVKIAPSVYGGSCIEPSRL